jgi:hypothetical protein
MQRVHLVEGLVEQLWERMLLLANMVSRIGQHSSTFFPFVGERTSWGMNLLMQP